MTVKAKQNSRSVNAPIQNPGQQEARNISPGRRQNWKEQNDGSDRKDNRMKPKSSDK